MKTKRSSAPAPSGRPRSEGKNERTRDSSSSATNKPDTLIEATAPEATQHLDTDQKVALDLCAEVEHTEGRNRERMTRKITQLGGGDVKPSRD